MPSPEHPKYISGTVWFGDYGHKCTVEPVKIKRKNLQVPENCILSFDQSHLPSAVFVFPESPIKPMGKPYGSREDANHVRAINDLIYNILEEGSPALGEDANPKLRRESLRDMEKMYRTRITVDDHNKLTTIQFFYRRSHHRKPDVTSLDYHSRYLHGFPTINMMAFLALSERAQQLVFAQADKGPVLFGNFERYSDRDSEIALKVEKNGDGYKFLDIVSLAGMEQLPYFVFKGETVFE